MMNYIFKNHLSLLIILFLVFSAFSGGGDSLGVLDSTTIENPWVFTNTVTNSSTVQVGSSGTALNRINAGTCYLAPSSATISASTTTAVDCQATAAVDASGISALAGVASGDFVLVTLSTTTAGATFEGLMMTGATASSTQGYITLQISNQTGTTYTWPITGAASGTASYISID